MERARQKPPAPEGHRLCVGAPVRPGLRGHRKHGTTIHDFAGFPRELYQVQCPAPGDPDLAHRVQQLLAPLPVRRDDHWRLDHGAWAVLCHVYPKADVPVVQLSIVETQPPSLHYEIGERLAALREERILITGSGNVVHNLHT